MLPIPNWTKDICQPSLNAINPPTKVPTHHLDSVKFRATSNAPGVSKATSNIYRKETHDEGSRDTLTFSIELFMRNDFIDILRVVFLVLDAILFVYRFSHTYCSATSLCYGFDDCLSLDGSINHNGGRGSVRSNRQNNESHKNSGQNHLGQNRTSDQTQYDPIPGDNVAEKPPQLRSSLRTHSSADDTHSNAHSSRTKPDSTFSSKHRMWRLFCRSAGLLVRSSAIPKLLLVCVLVLVVYNVLALVSDYIDVDLFLRSGALDEVLGRLDQHSEQTDQYLDIQADHLNVVSLRHYRIAMQMDLLNVEGLLAFFNAGVWGCSAMSLRAERLTVGLCQLNVKTVSKLPPQMIYPFTNQVHVSDVQIKSQNGGHLFVTMEMGFWQKKVQYIFHSFHSFNTFLCS